MAVLRWRALWQKHSLNIGQGWGDAIRNMFKIHVWLFYQNHFVGLSRTLFMKKNITAEHCYEYVCIDWS